MPTDFSTLEISTPEDPRRLLVRIILTSDNGQSTTLEPIELRLVRSGTEVFLLSNDQQPIPIKFWLTCNRLTLSGQYGLELEEGTLPVLWIKKWLEIQQIFTHPGKMSIKTVTTGEPWISARHEDSGIATMADPPYVEMVHDLCSVQEHIEQAIYLPWNDYSKEDRKTIALVRSIMREPAFEGTWSQSEGTMALANVRGLPAPLLAGEATGPLRAERPVWATLGGVKLYLGRIVNVLDTVRLVNFESVRRQIDEATSEDTPINFRFVPDKSDRVTVFYLDWILKLVAQKNNPKAADLNTKKTEEDVEAPLESSDAVE